MIIYKILDQKYFDLFFVSSFIEHYKPVAIKEFIIEILLFWRQQKQKQFFLKLSHSNLILDQ